MDCPPNLCPIHCCGWYGNVNALRLIMKTGKVPIDYKDMYGNTTVHYAVFKGHHDFVKICIEEFNANMLLLNNGKQSVLRITMDEYIALTPVETAFKEAKV